MQESGGFTKIREEAGPPSACADTGFLCKTLYFVRKGWGDVLTPLLLNLPFRDLWPSAEKPVRNVPEVPSCAVLLNQCIKMSK